MAPIDILLDDIFGSGNPALRAEFAGWVRESRRYKAFATDYHTKIRAKLRNARDDNGIQDVRTELEIAACLLREDRFTLEYEKYTASRQRGPDFTVTYRTHTPFNVEVRRLRLTDVTAEADAQTSKLMAVLCDKVGQMPAGIVNILCLIAAPAVTMSDLNQAAVNLRQLAEQKNDAFFAGRGFTSAVEFLKQYRNLSSVILRQPDSTALWQNPLAKHRTPPEIVTALERVLR